MKELKQNLFFGDVGRHLVRKEIKNLMRSVGDSGDMPNEIATLVGQKYQLDFQCYQQILSDNGKILSAMNQGRLLLLVHWRRLLHRSCLFLLRLLHRSQLLLLSPPSCLLLSQTEPDAVKDEKVRRRLFRETGSSDQNLALRLMTILLMSSLMTMLLETRMALPLMLLLPRGPRSQLRSTNQRKIRYKDWWPLF